MPYDSKKEFRTLSSPEYFTRVDESHPLNLWKGVNKSGMKTIRFIGDFRAVPVTGTKQIEVSQIRIDDKKAIQFSLISEESAELFYKFCDDLVDSSRTEANQAGGYTFIINRFAKWKRLFTTRTDLLTEESVMGLIGVLIFMKDYLFPKYGCHRSLVAWSASEPTLKDFSVGDLWFEIKTTGAKAKGIKVSSIEQLDSANPGYLVVYRLEKMSTAFNGINLNDLVIKINQLIDSPEDLDLFAYKLNQDKYSYNEKYNDYVFQLKETNFYEVNEKFPCLRRKNLDKSILNAVYDLSLDEIEIYKQKEEQ